MTGTTFRASLVALSCSLGLAGVAHADRADQLFKKGKKLLAEKRYPEACQAFQEVDQIDPGIGAKLNVARCFQEWGKLATAWRWYRDAEAMATQTKDDRAPKIRGLIEELEPSIPRLVLRLPKKVSADDVAIKLDGEALASSAIGEDQRVDPGPHAVEYTADGETQTKVVPLERGASVELVLEVDSAGPAVATSPARRDPGRTRRVVSLGVAGGGAIALGVAGVITLRARSDYQHALSAHCRDDANMCDAVGNDAASSARKRANISTVVTIGGAAAIAAGVYFYLTAPRAHPDEHALYLAPSVDADGSGVVFGGAF